MICGLDAVDEHTRAVVIGLGDKPFLSKSTIERLIERFEQSGPEVAIPLYRGKRGNPVLFSRSVFAELYKLKGDVGAKEVIKGKDHSVIEVSVNDPGVLFDLDTPDDLRKAEKLSSARPTSVGE